MGKKLSGFSLWGDIMRYRYHIFENVGRFVLPITAGGALLVSLLDLFGFLGQLDWLSSRVPTITLLLITATIIYWLEEQKREHEKIEMAIELASSGVCAKSWNTTEKAMMYLAMRFGEAEKMVDQSAMAPSLSPATEYKAYDEALTKMLEKGIKYRHVVLFDATRWGRVRSFINNPRVQKYFVSYYDWPRKTLPSLSFVVIDGREVVMRHPYGPDQPELWVSIMHKPTAELFTRYFNNLYDHGINLEKGNPSIVNKLNIRYDKQKS